MNSVYIVEKLVKLLLGIKAHKSAFLSGEVFFLFDFTHLPLLGCADRDARNNFEKRNYPSN